jgi:hypothetical protein
VLFVSRSSNHNIIFDDGEMEYYRNPNNNRVQRLIQKPPTIVEFKPQWEMLTEYERSFALQSFAGKLNYIEDPKDPENRIPVLNMHAPIRNHALGSAGSELRVTEDGVAQYTVGDRAEYHLGVYDTSTITDPEKRSYVEGLLLAHPELGVGFIKVENEYVAPPWPAYNDMTPKEMVKFIKQAGFDFNAIIMYESRHDNREDYIAELQAALSDMVDKAAENDSLSATT